MTTDGAHDSKAEATTEGAHDSKEEATTDGAHDSKAEAQTVPSTATVSTRGAEGAAAVSAMTRVRESYSTFS